MAENTGIELLDYLIFINRNKKFYITFVTALLLVVYALIYFFIPPQYESSASIVAVESSQSNPLSSIASSLSNLPLANIGFSGMGTNESYNLFSTIITSRTNLEKMIDKFHLMKIYNWDSREDAVKILGQSIVVELTEEGAYKIILSASDPLLAKKMVDFVLEEVNQAVINLNITKARENRIFLEARYSEIQNKLSVSEDALQQFQESSGFLEVTNQTKSIIEAYSKFEAELKTKETEYSILKEMLGDESPIVTSAKISLGQYNEAYKEFATSNRNESVFLPLKSLPSSGKTYLRHFRDVEINTAMLQFILPMLEQAKFEEIKAIPVLQVIDKPMVAEKKSYPPRVFFTLLISLFILFLTSAIKYLLELFKRSNDIKLVTLRNELFRYKTK